MLTEKRRSQPDAEETFVLSHDHVDMSYHITKGHGWLIPEKDHRVSHDMSYLYCSLRFDYRLEQSRSCLVVSLRIMIILLLGNLGFSLTRLQKRKLATRCSVDCSLLLVR